MSFWIKQWFKSRGDNFGVVSNFVLRSAQPSKKKLKEYKDKYGLRLVLNLCDDVEQEEIDEVLSLGLSFHNIPMSDSKPPTWDQINEALSYLREAEFSERTILVHCKGGRHRTSLICAAFAVRFKLVSKNQAWKEQADAYGYYGALGHEPLKTWFFENF